MIRLSTQILECWHTSEPGKIVHYLPEVSHVSHEDGWLVAYLVRGGVCGIKASVMFDKYVLKPGPEIEVTDE